MMVYLTCHYLQGRCQVILIVLTQYLNVEFVNLNEIITKYLYLNFRNIAFDITFMGVVKFPLLFFLVLFKEILISLLGKHCKFSWHWTERCLFFSVLFYIITRAIYLIMTNTWLENLTLQKTLQMYAYMPTADVTDMFTHTKPPISVCVYIFTNTVYVMGNGERHIRQLMWLYTLVRVEPYYIFKM